MVRSMIDRPNQVWAIDITYIPMARGFVYLAAVVDWHSLGRYLCFYNTGRPLSALDRQAPDQVCFQNLLLSRAT